MAAEIAEVSFDRFLHGTDADKKAVAQEIYDAFSTVGFVYVKDHGIPQARVDEIFAVVRSGRFTTWTRVLTLTSGQEVLRSSHRNKEPMAPP